MDEKGFRQYLEIKFENEHTKRQYFERTKQFENWLKKKNDKHIENADESDLNNWKSYVLKEHSSWTLYLHSIKNYYIFKHASQAEILKEIIKEIPPNTNRKQINMLWTDFEKNILKVKEKHIDPEHYTLLNLLWSEMESSDILNLYISDVDFERRLIAVGDKQYQATKTAWDALEELVVPENRGKKERLFNITSPRAIQQITRTNLGECGLTPNRIRQSCRDALSIAGKTVIFKTFKQPYAQTSTLPQKPTDSYDKKPKKLFDMLVEEISSFGGRLRLRIEKIKDENDLQRLLEGYLLAAFPDEKIYPEFPFKGHKPRSTIDFVIGEEKIPIEVEFAGTKTMGEHKRYGSSQVNEYLEHRKIEKGILVIGDKDRDYNNKKENGLLGKVYIMVI